MTFCGMGYYSPVCSFSREIVMLSWALTFLVLALVAGIFGATGVAGLSMNIAWILIVVFIVLFVISLMMGRRGPGASL